MRPDDHRTPLTITVPSRQTGVAHPLREQSQAAAEQLLRQKIDKIYDNDPNATTTVPAEKHATPTEIKSVKMQAPASTTTDTQHKPAVNVQADNQQKIVENPYERTHDESQHQTQAGEWQKYHTAWQSYYQQYYERYYINQVSSAKQTLKKSMAEQRQLRKPIDETISSDEAMNDIRSQLRGKIAQRAKKVRKSRQFIPIILAACVMITFLFLQYNRVVFAAFHAYIAPGEMDQDSLMANPSAAGTITSDPRIIIPKIAVDNTPIIFTANASSQASLDKAMEEGVAWFNIPGANAKPGEKGNFVVSGHSSNDWLDPGDYNFIFGPLEKMKKGDPIYVNYEGKRYTYAVTGTKVVKPTEVSALQIGYDAPRITLITCTPLGTALNRLLVFADQVDPDPSTAVAINPASTSSSAARMPSNSPTFAERLAGKKDE